MEIKEFPSYPATKFVTDIGGWLGLFSGLSFLSIVEVLLFVLLSVIVTLRKLRYVCKTRRRIKHDIPPV